MDNVHAVLSGCDTMDDMDQIKHHAHNIHTETSALQDTRLFNEINLLRLEGFYFCLDPKEAVRRTNKKYEFFEIIRRPKSEIEKRPVVIGEPVAYGQKTAVRLFTIWTPSSKRTIFSGRRLIPQSL